MKLDTKINNLIVKIFRKMPYLNLLKNNLRFKKIY